MAVGSCAPSTIARPTDEQRTCFRNSLRQILGCGSRSSITMAAYRERQMRSGNGAGRIYRLARPRRRTHAGCSAACRGSDQSSAGASISSTRTNARWMTRRRAACFTSYSNPNGRLRLMFNGMLTGHLTVYRRAVVEDLGGFRSAYDFSQDYDLALRMAEVVKHVVHVERVFYSMAFDPRVRGQRRQGFRAKVNIGGAERRIAAKGRSRARRFRCNTAIASVSRCPQTQSRCQSSSLQIPARTCVGPGGDPRTDGVSELRSGRRLQRTACRASEG